MIEKKLSLIITFPSTTSAMAAEACFKDNNCTGRLIPIPTQITASCGLSWKSEIEQEEYLKRLLESNSIKYENMLHLEF